LALVLGQLCRAWVQLQAASQARLSHMWLGGLWFQELGGPIWEIKHFPTLKELFQHLQGLRPLHKQKKI